MAHTIGHSARHGGLRGHSVGDIYPFIVRAEGPVEGQLIWRVTHCDGWTSDHEFTSAAAAYKHAANLKEIDGEDL